MRKVRGKNIKLRVKNLIEKYNTRNPYELCRKLKITIICRDLGKPKGWFQKVLRRKYIFLNGELDEYSKLIVLCHELGHAILHHSEKIGFMKTNFLNYTSELEKEANEFAAELMKYQEEVGYEIARDCDLGLQLLEEMKNYVKYQYICAKIIDEVGGVEKQV